MLLHRSEYLDLPGGHATLNQCGRIRHPSIIALWASEIAERTGRTRQSVDQLIKARRGPGGFPSPASHATRNPLWRWSEVETWFAAYEGRQPDTERSVVLGAINGALQARHSLRGAHEAGPLHRALKQLLAS